MNYDTIQDEAIAMSLAEQIDLITRAANGDDYRMFCRIICAVTMEYASKRCLNFAAIDQIILAAHRFEKVGPKVGMLRNTYAYRRYMKNWHTLRDCAHVQAYATEPERARRLMVGFYEEVRNSVHDLWWMLTPHISYGLGFPQDHFWPRPNWKLK